MKNLMYLVLCILPFIGSPEKARGQIDRHDFYGNDPVSDKKSPETITNPIIDISTEYLDSLGLSAISVETHLGYCDDAKPAIILHKQHGTAILSDQGAGCPLKLSFKQDAEEVHLSFTGCAGKYKLVGYDSSKNIVVENTMDIELWGLGEIAIKSDLPNIHYITFARGSGCSTYIKSVKHH